MDTNTGSKLQNFKIASIERAQSLTFELWTLLTGCIITMILSMIAILSLSLLSSRIGGIFFESQPPPVIGWPRDSVFRYLNLGSGDRGKREDRVDSTALHLFLLLAAIFFGFLFFGVFKKRPSFVLTYFIAGFISVTGVSVLTTSRFYSSKLTGTVYGTTLTACCIYTGYLIMVIMTYRKLSSHKIDNLIPVLRNVQIISQKTEDKEVTEPLRYIDTPY